MRTEIGIAMVGVRTGRPAEGRRTQGDIGGTAEKADDGELRVDWHTTPNGASFFREPAGLQLET